jgi:hypothetical protein
VELRLLSFLTSALDGVVSLTPPLLYSQGKSPLYVLKRRLDVPQSQYGHFGEEKNLFPLPGFEPQIIQFIAQSQSHCTEYAVSASIIVVNFVKYTPCHRAFCRCV